MTISFYLGRCFIRFDRKGIVSYGRYITGGFRIGVEIDA